MRMLKNKAQIARESIKTSESFQGPKDWAILEAGQTGGGGGMMAPLKISAVDRAIPAKICTMVVCDVIYKTVYWDFPNKFSFILY